MSKHTPVDIFKTSVLGVGPWCVEFADGEIVTCRAEDRARLFAAAPDLLEAARAAGDILARGKWLDTSPDSEAVALRALCDAIAKATGEQP